MSIASGLYNNADIPDEDVDGPGYNLILDMQYWAPVNFQDAFTSVILPRTSQSNTPITVFDNKFTGLYFMRSTWRRKQTFCALGEDGLVGVQAVSWIKLLIFDAACPYLQRLFASFTPIYAGGRTLFLSRYNSDCMIINEALESIGKRINTKAELVTNAQLYSERVHMVVFDYNWALRVDGINTVPGVLDSTLVDSDRLLNFHSVWPNSYFRNREPGSRLEYQKS
jgi:hypothetical protein